MFIRKRNYLLVTIAWCFYLEPVYGDFVVENVQANLVQQELHVSTKINLSLSEQAELAVDNGVPLVVLTEFALIKDGILWNKTLLKHKNGQQLRYHSLSDRYVVEDLDVEEIDTYGSVTEALQSMGAFRSVVLPLPESMGMDATQYTLSVRSRLDINKLPAALRPLAFFSPSWRLTTDWTSWQITNP